MANPVVADTDLVIDFLRGSGPGVAIVRALIAERRLRLTVLTAYELGAGADIGQRRADIARLFRRRTVQLDLRAAVRAGEIGGALTRAGLQIGPADSIQAGICLRHGYALATRNRKHFERVDGLELFPAA